MLIIQYHHVAIVSAGNKAVSLYEIQYAWQEGETINRKAVQKAILLIVTVSKSVNHFQD